MNWPIPGGLFRPGEKLGYVEGICPGKMCHLLRFGIAEFWQHCINCHDQLCMGTACMMDS